MPSLLTQLASNQGFWRSPSVYTVADIIVTVCLVLAVALLWRRFARWRKTTAPLFAQVGRVMGDIADLRGDLTRVKHDMVEVRHDVNAVGETVSSLGESLGTDIVQSEERILAKLSEVADAQITMMQTLSVRPCIVRETAAREDGCAEGDT
jgi:hypothetical protein